jgi:hypothetical protein
MPGRTSIGAGGTVLERFAARTLDPSLPTIMDSAAFAPPRTDDDFGAARPAPAAAPHAAEQRAAAPGRAAARPARADRSFALVLGSTTAAILLAFAIGRSGWFTPGDNVGYYIGLVGGVMLLTLLLYPLRKHVPFFRNWGKVKGWFSVHMVIGICGPVLVLVHSTFHMRSVNASVALICMLVVAGSGIVGRFLYTKVHRGLYGERLNLQELQRQTGSESAEIRSRLHFAPAVEKRLADFQSSVLQQRGSLLVDFLHACTVSTRGYATYRRCAHDLRISLEATAAARGWDKPKLRRRLSAARGLVKAHLDATRRVAQFSTYDRLLQLWHVAHVPLVYLLVISAVAHVVAVHMY